MKNGKSSVKQFVGGRVFGFDIGTGSIGYAVREGQNFLKTGVIICENEAGDLSERRSLRRQRRTLRSRKQRRKWFVRELANIGISRSDSAVDDPTTLRVKAIRGEDLTSGELYTALTHLFKRRGYTEVPWANRIDGRKESDTEKEEGAIKEKVKAMRESLLGTHPCEFLDSQRRLAGKSPTDPWRRKIYWPRDALEKEFRAMAHAQRIRHPQLESNVDWLLYGETKKVRGAHVYFTKRDGKNPGILGLCWPKFDNRGPNLDSLRPLDESGRSLHVARKNKPAYLAAQWDLALLNFRVLDINTSEKVDPRLHYVDFVETLKDEWTKRGKVTIARLKRLAEPYSSAFVLIQDQKPLTPDKGSGRCRYSTPTLEWLRKEIAEGKRVDPPQPLLRRNGESLEAALNRFISEVKHPLVRHRLDIFRGLLKKLIREHGAPDVVVVEAVRSLAMGKKAKAEFNQRNEQNRREREIAREQLVEAGSGISKNRLLRYQLWKEAHSICPFCAMEISQEQLLNGHADIEHIVPRSTMDCSERYNLTVGHYRCNREIKGDRTPYDAFSGDAPHWQALTQNAMKCFTGLKLELFLSPQAESLVERKADLQHTAYIARLIRGVVLLDLGWISEDGRDPTIERGNVAASGFQVTNGQLTSRLRKAWGLNRILHLLPAGTHWEELSAEEKSSCDAKNRGDLRHHALDAMVIACTLPWLAHRTHGATDAEGNHGWWTQDEKQRSRAANLVYPTPGAMHSVCERELSNVDVRNHVSRSRHRRGYATTLYARKAPNTYVAREKITGLKPRDFRDIWPKELGAYLEEAWQRYGREESGVDEELKKTKGCFPESFTGRLCFSHFQRWRAEGAPEFSWPKKIKIPIRSVSLIAVKDDGAVTPHSKGTHAYVKRTGFREARIYASEDGKQFVPVFVPYWRKDLPATAKTHRRDETPITVIRRGMVIDLKKTFAGGYPAGKYRVVSTKQKQLELVPIYLADKPDILKAYGFGADGAKPSWNEFLTAAGYELPHLTSAKSRP